MVSNAEGVAFLVLDRMSDFVRGDSNRGYAGIARNGVGEAKYLASRVIVVGQMSLYPFDAYIAQPKSVEQYSGDLIRSDAARCSYLAVS